MYLPSHLESALPNPEAAALIIDESGTIVYVSDTVRGLLGHAPEDLCGQTVEMLLPERLRLAHIGQRLKFTDDHRHRPMGTGLPLLAVDKQGAELPVDISLNPVQRGLLTFTVAVIQPRELHPPKHAHTDS